MSDLARRILEACYVTRPLDGDPDWYDEALAEVQRLLGEHQPPWISVKDRLPEDRQSVAFIVHASVYHGRRPGGWFYRGYHDLGACAFGTPGRRYYASHWMPLPELPDGVEEAS